MDTKIAALAEHKSQFDIKDVEPFVRRWTGDRKKFGGSIRSRCQGLKKNLFGFLVLSSVL